MPFEALSGSFTNRRVQRVIYGTGSLRQLPDELARLGRHRALLVCGRTIHEKTDLLEVVRQTLGPSCVGVFPGAREHAPIPSLEEGAAMVRELQADILVSVGGGSAVDTAKGIALVHKGPGALERFRGKPASYGDPEPVTDAGLQGIDPETIPNIAVTTTLSGAEFTFQAGITDPVTRRKDQYYDMAIAPRTIILDPRMTVATPPELWLSSGIKALDHNVERIYSRNHNPFSDALSLESIRLIVRFLERSRDPQELEARCHLQLAAWMSVFTTDNVNVGIGHAIDHQLCAYYHIGHGVAAGIMLPNAMTFNKEAAQERLAVTAPALGVNVERLDQAEAAGRAITAVRELVRRLGLPGRLRDVVPDKGQFDVIADRTLTDTAVTGNPVPVTSRKQVLQVLESAW